MMKKEKANKNENQYKFPNPCWLKHTKINRL